MLAIVWGPSDIAQVASAVVALVATIVSGWIAWLALRESASQGSLNRAAIRRQYHGEVIRWADEAVMNLSRAEALCDLDPGRLHTSDSFRLRQLGLMAELSGIIDRGRWFLPNDKRDDHGKEKEKAFQGYRHPALDCLVEAYRITGGLDYDSQKANRDRKPELISCKRAFVSHIQSAIEPQEFKVIIESLRHKGKAIEH